MLNYYHSCARGQKGVDGDDMFENRLYATNNDPYFMRLGCGVSPKRKVQTYRTDLLGDEGYQTMIQAPSGVLHNWDYNTDIGQFSVYCDANSRQHLNPSEFLYPRTGYKLFPESENPFQPKPEFVQINRNLNVDASASQTHKDSYAKRLKGTSERSRDCVDSRSNSGRSRNGNNKRSNRSSPWQSNYFMETSCNKENCMPSDHKTSDQDNGICLESSDSNKYVDLHVTKLDETLDRLSVRKTLRKMFQEHVPVVSMHLFTAGDNSLCASVTVPSKQHAQYAISQMQKQRIGTKRIIISYAGGNERNNNHMLKFQVRALLQSIPGQALPLFKFLELFESHYFASISLSDLFRMREVCRIVEHGRVRIVELNAELKGYPDSPRFPNKTEGSEFPYCLRHCKTSADQCWALRSPSLLPNVHIEIDKLNENLCKLIESHNGSVPLPSLATCYEADLEIALTIDQKSGVALEHLVSCCPNILIKQSSTGVKHIIMTTQSDKNLLEESAMSKNISPALAHHFLQFSREIIDLLRTCSKCQLLFNKFIPAYHHHFGRQCRVADYGYTKLIDLFDSLSSTVQVMGQGDKRFVTLTHRAQIRRFTSDLCKILKAQNTKQMTLSELPSQYNKVFDRTFDVTEYGVCVVADILNQVNENTIVRKNLPDGDVVLSRPKHDQTDCEMRKTNSFKLEVIELLSYAPQYTMQFNRFVPAYHHHFGLQCRVSEYGFSKLIELFESIPDIVQIIECESNNEDRQVCLTTKEAINVVGIQIEQILWSQENFPKTMNLTQVCAEFTRRFGYALRADFYKCKNMDELLAHFNNIKVTKTVDGETTLKLLNFSQQGPPTLRRSKRSSNSRNNPSKKSKSKSNKRPIDDEPSKQGPESVDHEMQIKDLHGFTGESLRPVNRANVHRSIKQNGEKLLMNILQSSEAKLKSSEQNAYRQFVNDLKQSWPPKSPNSSVDSGTDVSSILNSYGYGYNYLDEISLGQNNDHQFLQHLVEDAVSNTNPDVWGLWKPSMRNPADFVVNLPSLKPENTMMNIPSPSSHLMTGNFHQFTNSHEMMDSSILVKTLSPSKSKSIYEDAVVRRQD